MQTNSGLNSVKKSKPNEGEHFLTFHSRYELVDEVLTKSPNEMDKHQLG